MSKNREEAKASIEKGDYSFTWSSSELIKQFQNDKFSAFSFKNESFVFASDAATRDFYAYVFDKEGDLHDDEDILAYYNLEDDTLESMLVEALDGAAFDSTSEIQQNIKIVEDLEEARAGKAEDHPELVFLRLKEDNALMPTEDGLEVVLQMYSAMMDDFVDYAFYAFEIHE